MIDTAVLKSQAVATAIYGLGYTSGICLLCKIALPRENPLRLLAKAVRGIFTSWRRVLFFLGFVALIFVNVVQTKIDPRITARFGRDFTPLFYAIEGGVTSGLQRFMQPALLYLLSYFYLMIFPMMVAVSLIIYYRQREKRLLLAVLVAYWVNYLIVLPFYLFFPVNEVWAHPDTGARLLINQVSPLLMDSFRPMSGLDNCFPSFHTSLSVTLAFIAFHSRNRRFFFGMLASAGIILFSTLYLGIHWLIDVGAGILVGYIGYWIGMEAGDRASTCGWLTSHPHVGALRAGAAMR